MARTDRHGGPVTDEELAVLREEIAALQQRVREDLARATGRTPAAVEAAVDEYDLPDPDDLEAVPAEEFYDDR